MSWAVMILCLACFSAAADVPRGDRATPQQTWPVVAMRTNGEASHDPGGRLAVERAREATGTLRLRIVERRAGQVAPVPARVHLADAAGKPVLAPGLPAWRDHFNCEGDVRLDLPPGRYNYTVERGPEYRRTSGSFTLSAGEVREQEVVLRRLIDLASLGWYSGETHVHRSPDELPLLLRSEDLHVAPVLTVWNQNNHWKDQPLPERLLVDAGPDRAYHLLACEDERRGGALLLLQSRPAAGFRGRRTRIPIAGRPSSRGGRAAGSLGRCGEAVLVGYAHLGGDGEGALDRAGQQPHVP